MNITIIIETQPLLTNIIHKQIESNSFDLERFWNNFCDSSFSLIPRTTKNKTKIMPAIYHSGCRSKQRIANIAKLTFRTKINGPIKTLDPEHVRKEDPVGLDIIDETFYYFKSNLFFNQYEIMSESDRNLIYITLFILECLKMISKSGFNRRQAQQDLFSLSQQKFALPGDARFPLNQMYSKPKTVAEEEELRAYLLQVRQECSLRLLDLVWPKEERQPSKWWMCFSKRKFMNITLNEVQAY